MKGSDVGQQFEKMLWYILIEEAFITIANNGNCTFLWEDLSSCRPMKS